MMQVGCLSVTLIAVLLESMESTDPTEPRIHPLFVAWTQAVLVLIMTLVYLILMARNLCLAHQVELTLANLMHQVKSTVWRRYVWFFCP